MPKILDRAVRHIKARRGGPRIKNPWAVATASLQRAGILKKGTRTLTAKGRRRARAKR